MSPVSGPVALRDSQLLALAERAECGDGIIHVAHVTEAMSTHVRYSLLCDEPNRNVHAIHTLGSMTSINIPGANTPRSRHANAKFYTAEAQVTCMGCLAYGGGS